MPLHMTAYSDLTAPISALLTNNAPMPTAFLMHPRTLFEYSDLLDGDNNPLVKPDIIKNIPFLDTTGIGITDTVGTSTNCSKIIMGDFSQLMIGIR